MGELSGKLFQITMLLENRVAYAVKNASERSFLCSRSVIYFYLFIYIYFYVKKNILYKTSTLNWLKEARCTPWIYKDTNKPIFTELHFIVSLYRTLQKI